MAYGPKRPDSNISYNNYRVPSYLIGHAKKIRHDILKKFRLYEGKLAYLFSVDTTGLRCTNCIDTITGAVTLDDCDVCGGTGYINGYQYINTYWIKIEITPEQDSTTEFGNTENSGTRRELITLVDAELLNDKDLLVLVDTGDIYKVLDFAPQIAALSGEIITQTVQCSYLTRGCTEYSIIETLLSSLSGSGSGSGS